MEGDTALTTSTTTGTTTTTSDQSSAVGAMEVDALSPSAVWDWDAGPDADLHKGEPVLDAADQLKPSGSPPTTTTASAAAAATGSAPNPQCPSSSSAGGAAIDVGIDDAVPGDSVPGGKGRLGIASPPLTMTATPKSAAQAAPDAAAAATFSAADAAALVLPKLEQTVSDHGSNNNNNSSSSSSSVVNITSPEPSTGRSPRQPAGGALFGGTAPRFHSGNPDSPQRLLHESGRKHYYTAEKPLQPRPRSQSPPEYRLEKDDISYEAKVKAKTWSPLRLISIDPMASLLQTLQVLLKEKVHRLPIIDKDTGNVFAILTHLRLLVFLHTNFIKRKGCTIEMFKLKLSQLDIGTKTSVAAIQEDTPLISVLNIFCERRISALPVVDQVGKVVDLYRKHDAMNLARDRSYNNLDVSVSVALRRRKKYNGVQTCVMGDTLGDVVDKLVAASVHRLVIVDSHDFLIGILSLSDLLGFLFN
eukprot:gene1526-28595_t